MVVSVLARGMQRRGGFELPKGTPAHRIMSKPEAGEGPPRNDRLPEVGRSALTPASQTEDLLLLRRVQRREEEALSALYDRWVDPVYAVAAHLVGALDEAEDVVEKTFSQVWSDADRYEDGRGSVGTWIILIARSRALDRLRSTQRRQKHHVSMTDTAMNATASDRPSPLQDASAGEQRGMVADALERLPNDQREVVRLTFFGGLTQREIADHLGLPLGTVKTRVRLAFAKLRGSLRALQEMER